MGDTPKAADLPSGLCPIQEPLKFKVSARVCLSGIPGEPAFETQATNRTQTTHLG